MKFESLGSSVVGWMRSRGLFKQTDLTAEQLVQLKECFHIFDVDESGTVDIEEILAAMQLLGLPAKRKVVQRQMEKLQRGKRETCPAAEMDLGFEDFVELMTSFFMRRESMTSSGVGDFCVGNDGVNDAGAMQNAGMLSKDDQVDFNLLAQALRRRNILDAVMTDPTKSISRYQLVAGRAGRRQPHESGVKLPSHGLDDAAGSLGNSTPRRARNSAQLKHYPLHTRDADSQATPSSSASAHLTANVGDTVQGEEEEDGRRMSTTTRELARDRSGYRDEPSRLGMYHVVGDGGALGVASRAAGIPPEPSPRRGGAPVSTAACSSASSSLLHNRRRRCPASCRPMPAILESSLGTLESHLDAMTRTLRADPDGFVGRAPGSLGDAAAAFMQPARLSDAQFIPADRFEGRRQGFVFTRRQHGTGYYRDASATGDSSARTRARDVAADDDDAVQRGVMMKRVKVDGEALLREAEERNGHEPAVDDAKSIRKAMKLLRKRFEENATARVRYADSPGRFLDSEIALAVELHRVSSVAAAPSLFLELLSAEPGAGGLGFSPLELLSSLLGHENTDIAAEAVRMLRELTDTDALAECDDADDGDGGTRRGNRGGRDPSASVSASGGGRNGAGLGEAAVRMVRAAASCSTAVVQNLSRLDEAVEAEQEAVANVVGFVDNLVECGELELVDTLISKTKILRWLLFRIGKRDGEAGATGKTSADGTDRTDGSGLQAAATDLLAGLLQASQKAREALGEKGVEAILVALSVYRKRVHVDAEAAEMLETLSSSLCSALLVPANRRAFTELEGFELVVILLKVKSRAVRRCAVQVLDFALTRNAVGAEKLVRVSGGLGIAFAIFMGKLKYLASSSAGGDTSALGGGDGADVTTRGVGIVFSLFELLPAGADRDRVAAKMVEADYEKCDRLVELYFAFKERIAKSVRAVERHAAALRVDEVTENDLYAARVEGGQDALQQVAHIMAHAYALGHLGIQSRLLLLLRRGNETLRDVRAVLDTYCAEIGDDDSDEAQTRRRASLRALQRELCEPEERDVVGATDGDSHK